jgi:hypothetical protein
MNESRLSGFDAPIDQIIPAAFETDSWVVILRCKAAKRPSLEG